MGIWIEIGVFLLALGIGIWQLRDVRKAQAERRAREQQLAAAPDPSRRHDPP